MKTPNTPRWKDITFQVFDVPSMGHEPFEKRLDWLKSTFMRLNGECREKHVRVVDQMKAKSREHVLEMLKDIEEMGGEGLMLRKPESYVLCFRASISVSNSVRCTDCAPRSHSILTRLYEGRRSSTLQKIKACDLSFMINIRFICPCACIVY